MCPPKSIFSFVVYLASQETRPARSKPGHPQKYALEARSPSDTCRGKATRWASERIPPKAVVLKITLSISTRTISRKTASRLAMLIDCYSGASSYEVGHRIAGFIPVVADRIMFLANADLGGVLIDEDLGPSIAVDGFRETRAFLRSVPIRNPPWTRPPRPTLLTGEWDAAGRWAVFDAAGVLCRRTRLTTNRF